VDVVVRQAHPGPDVPSYQNFEQKMQDGRRYQQDEDIPWSIVVDDLEGTVHQVYGSLSDPTYLIDIDGRVTYYNMWTHVPNVHTALEAMRKQGWRGVVNGGIDRVPHMAPWMTHGWRGIKRGLPQSFLDLETSLPSSGLSTWLGYQLRGLLGPLTLRDTPLPVPVKIALSVGMAATVALAVRLTGSRSRD
jgi:hypothetical protein